MARPGYISVYADERTQKIFDEFTIRKGITKSTALTEMMRIYMLAQDEELYLELWKESFNIPRAKELLLQAEDITELNDYIFMKLGTAYTYDGKELNGIETMEAHMTSIEEYGYTWFGTKSLTTGMAKEKVKFYNDAIKRGEQVKILFAIGMGINEVKYSAVIHEVVTSRDEILCPGDATTIPKEFGPQEKGKIWFRITDLKEEENITVNMLKFRKDSGSVENAIRKSQFHFGYVYIDC